MPQIFVGNLPFNASEADLRGRFERFGRVSSVRIVADVATNRPRGFAFVQMPSLDDADEAIARMAGSSMGGRLLTINESQNSPAPPRPASTSSSDTYRSNDFTRNNVLQMFQSLRDDQPT